MKKLFKGLSVLLIMLMLVMVGCSEAELNSSGNEDTSGNKWLNEFKKDMKVEYKVKLSSKEKEELKKFFIDYFMTLSGEDVDSYMSFWSKNIKTEVYTAVLITSNITMKKYDLKYKCHKFSVVDKKDNIYKVEAVIQTINNNTMFYRQNISNYTFLIERGNDGKLYVKNFDNKVIEYLGEEGKVKQADKNKVNMKGIYDFVLSYMETVFYNYEDLDVLLPNYYSEYSENMDYEIENYKDFFEEVGNRFQVTVKLKNVVDDAYYVNGYGDGKSRLRYEYHFNVYLYDGKGYYKLNYFFYLADMGNGNIKLIDSDIESLDKCSKKEFDSGIPLKSF